MRKDALTGLQQVFQQHPQEVRKQVMPTIMQHNVSLWLLCVKRQAQDTCRAFCKCLQTNMLLGSLAECIGDVDKGVRAALKELLANGVLPQLKGPLLGPFLPLVMAHLFSALTSMTDAVR